MEKLSLTRFKRVENQLFRCFNRRERAFMMLAIKRALRESEGVGGIGCN